MARRRPIERPATDAGSEELRWRYRQLAEARFVDPRVLAFGPPDAPERAIAAQIRGRAAELELADVPLDRRLGSIESLIDELGVRADADDYLLARAGRTARSPT